MKILTCAIFALLLIGCSSSQQTTEVRPEHVDYTPPPTRDSVVMRDSIVYRLVPVKRDSVVTRDSVIFTWEPFYVWTGHTVTSRGDSITAKFDGQTEKLSVEINYAKQSVPYQDSIKIVKPPDVIETPFLSKMGLVGIGLLIGAIGVGGGIALVKAGII